MATKTAKKETKTESKAVAVKATSTAVAESNVDAMLMMRQNAGAGVSTSVEDNILPRLYILQAQSPQALRQKPEYIQGAVAGNIWPRGSKVLIDGDEGLPVISCGVRKYWVEWKPNRGGLVGSHEYVEKDADKGRPGDAELVEDPQTGFKNWIRADTGNILVETREHAVLALINDVWSPYVIAMSGSNHTAARTWNGARLNQRFSAPNNDFVPPAMAFVYTAKTIAKANEKGDWFGWAFEDGIAGERTETLALDDGLELFRKAVALHDQFMAGVKKGEEEIDVSASEHEGDM